MKPLGGRAGFTGTLAFLPQRFLRPLQCAALALLLSGLAISVNAAQVSPSKARDHVYLLRGAFNVFSLGMDEIAAKLERQGVSTTVANYLAWPTLANEAAAEYKAGHLRNIILVGHSSGAMAVTEMAARLGQLGVPVKLAIGLDPTSREIVSGNVQRYINYYIANGLGASVARSRQFTGVLENVDVEKNPQLGHFNIDKDQSVQEQVIRQIRSAL
jgi:pimeloyl-ACP methyl ester carboxylesterase